MPNASNSIQAFLRPTASPYGKNFTQNPLVSNLILVFHPLVDTFITTTIQTVHGTIQDGHLQIAPNSPDQGKEYCNIYDFPVTFSMKYLVIF